MTNSLKLPGIGQWEGCIVRLFNGLPIEVDKRDVVGGHIASYGIWEKESVKFVCKFLKPGMVVIDAGAHIGQYSMISSRYVEPAGQVHAFEPHPGLFTILQRNLKRADCRNIVANQLALGIHSERRLLYPSTINNIGSTSFVPIEEENSNPIPVDAVRLDDYVAKHAIKRVDFIKIDVEGAERELLQGAEKTLKANPDVVLMIEFHALNVARFGYTLDELGLTLRRLGFHFFGINWDGLAPYRFLPEQGQNVVAVRELSTLLRNLPETYAARSLIGLTAQKYNN